MPLGLGSYFGRSIVRPGRVRKALRRSRSRLRPDLADYLRGQRPAIFDPIGARVTRRTATMRGVIRAARRLQ